MDQRIGVVPPAILVCVSYLPRNGGLGPARVGLLDSADFRPVGDQPNLGGREFSNADGEALKRLDEESEEQITLNQF